MPHYSNLPLYVLPPASHDSKIKHHFFPHLEQSFDFLKDAYLDGKGRVKGGMLKIFAGFYF